MSERLDGARFYPREQQEIEALGPKTLGERITVLRSLIRAKREMVKMSIFGSIISGGISGGLVTAQQLDALSDSRWYLIPEILLGMAAAGSVISIQEDRRKKKALEEILEVQTRIADHPTAGSDETLARSVYDLDLRPSNDQLTNLKKVLDSLREQNLLTEHSE